MSLFAKIMVVLNLIFAALFLAAAGTFLGAADNWKSKHELLSKAKSEEIATLNETISNQDKKYQTLMSEKAAAETAKAAIEGQLRVLQESNTTEHEQNAKLQASLDTLSAAQTDLQARLSEQQTEIGRLNGELSREIAEKREAQDQNATLQGSLARETQAREDAEASAAALEQHNTALAADVSSRDTVIRLYMKEVGPLPTGMTPDKPLDAVISSVDNAADVYVLSVGKNDAVKPGWQFTVYRDGAYIATVVVDEVFEQYASARSVRGMKKSDIRAGDSATNRL